MENLTFAHQILKSSTPEPLEGHTIVVLETVGTAGEKFKCALPPGQEIGKRGIEWPWKKVPNLSAYAVTAAPAVRVKFSTDMRMDDDLHALTLEIELVLSVSDPRELVKRRAEDPLQKIREESMSLFRREIARADWKEVVHTFRDLESEVVDRALPRLRSFAGDFGILIKDVDLYRRIPEDDGGKPIARLRAAAEVAQVEREIEQDAKIEAQKYEAERQNLQATLDAYRRNSTFLDGAVTAAVSALQIAANAVGDPRTLLQTVTTLNAAMAQMRMLAGGGEQPSLPGSSSSRHQLGAGDGSGADSIIAEMLLRTSEIACDDAVGRRLRSALLHLIAELLPAEEPDAAVIDELRRKVVEAGSGARLSAAQAEYVRGLLSTDTLRARLK